MEFRDLFWLLLPLAAASGWYAARREQRRGPTHSRSEFSSDYFRGINYLLNEQPDKAIEVFTRMVEVNSETIETHLALGSLFRRRGEVERAIRIHQNLIARPTLDRAQRSQALCELALDYHKAGLLDRAENLFLELAEIPAHSEQALRSLMHIYEQEKDWASAIGSGRRLAQASSQALGPVLAQYSCELAERSLRDGDLPQARRQTRDALGADARCVRASLLAGRIALREGRLRDAIGLWQKIEQQDAVLLDEAISDIAAAFLRLDDERGLYLYLQGVTQRQPGVRALQVFVELILKQEGLTAAREYVAGRLRDLPSVPGLKALVELSLAQNRDVEGDLLAQIKPVLDQLSAEQQGYQCKQCGFRGQALHWQCPACYSWATLQPSGCSVISPPHGPKGSFATAGASKKNTV
jgi:lipopolysaccharide biosynthesis regulator YciM